MNLITTIGLDLSLLDYFLKYYAGFNFNSYIFLINNKDYESVCQKINAFFKQNNNVWCPIVIYEKFDGEFTETKKIELEISTIKKLRKDYRFSGMLNHWFVYVDSDEFLYIPGGFANRIKLAEMYGFGYIEGKIVDRISDTYILRNINCLEKLETQFPIGCNITKNICKAWDKKIIAAKGHLKVGGGHHVLLNDREYNNTFAQPYNENLSPWSFGIELHHFKWHSTLLEKYEQVKETTDISLDAWRLEYELFFRKYKFCKGNLQNLYNISDYYIGDKLGI